MLSHLRFVVHIARGYMGYGLPLGDLIQEGNVGLMKAVKRFDPDMGVRLVCFAVHWIRAEIHEYVLRNWRLVKVATTKAQRKLFFNLRRMKKNLAWLSDAETNAVAGELGVEPGEVREMERRLSARDLSFDPAPDAGDEESVVSPSLYLPSAEADPATIVEQDQWDGAVGGQPRDRAPGPRRAQPDGDQGALAGRAEDKKTLQELADEVRRVRRAHSPDRIRGDRKAAERDGRLTPVRRRPQRPPSPPCAARGRAHRAPGLPLSPVPRSSGRPPGASRR